MRKAAVLVPAVGLLGGCGLEKYTQDPTNITILVIFGGLLALGLLLTFVLSRGPEAPEERREMARRERNWLRDLEEARNDFVRAQQEALDRALSMMNEEQKQDRDLQRLRLKSHAAMSRVLRLQEEMLKAGVAEEKVSAWQL